MAYLHCHNCDWGQDDFWSFGGYNPINSLRSEYYEKNLFEEKAYFDHNFFVENNLEGKMIEDKEGFWIRGQDLIAWNLREKANGIESMVVKTNEEWKKIKDGFVCPKCGNKNLDVD